MNKTRLFKRSLLAVTVTLATQQAMAAGFQLNAQLPVVLIIVLRVLF